MNQWLDQEKSIVKIIYVTTCTCGFVFSLHCKDFQMFMLFIMSLSEVARMVNAMKLETLVPEWLLHFLSAIL
jgi:hypothetical protein